MDLVNFQIKIILNILAFGKIIKCLENLKEYFKMVDNKRLNDQIKINKLTIKNQLVTFKKSISMKNKN